MRVGKAHPTEPVAVGLLLLEPANRSIGDPVRVVPLARHGVVLHLRRIGVAAAGGVHVEVLIDDLVKAADRLGVFVAHPLGVVQRAHDAVRRELEVVEASVHAATSVEPVLFNRRDAEAREGVLGVEAEGIHERLEVRLADQRGA